VNQLIHGVDHAGNHARTHARTQQQQLLQQHACQFMQRYACRSMHAGSCMLVHASCCWCVRAHGVRTVKNAGSIYVQKTLIGQIYIQLYLTFKLKHLSSRASMLQRDVLVRLYDVDLRACDAHVHVLKHL
jgi:hypothetical protein